MANFDPQLVTPTLTQAPSALSGTGPVGGVGATSSVEPHHSVIGMVLIAALAIFALDKAGFRFAVTKGRR